MKAGQAGLPRSWLREETRGLDAGMEEPGGERRSARWEWGANARWEGESAVTLRQRARKQQETVSQGQGGGGSRGWGAEQGLVVRTRDSDFVLEAMETTEGF